MGGGGVNISVQFASPPRTPSLPPPHCISFFPKGPQLIIPPPHTAVRLSPAEWTPGGDGKGGGGRGGGLLTPTHKLVRHCLRQRFAAEVAEMAAETA